ncbi:MAG TPA: hypothetical protein VIJ21_00070 [Solirubrobacterales bacterium]
MTQQPAGSIWSLLLYALYGIAALLALAGFLAEVVFVGAWIGLWPLPNER